MDLKSYEERKKFIDRLHISSRGVEDISLIKYNSPINDDMAIGIVIFNPANSKRIIMNYLYMIEKIKLAKIPYYVIELVFDHKTPEISEAYHVYTDKYGFYKEQLFRLLEKKIPSKYTKLCFLDADIIFLNPDWYNETSELLNSFEIIHPYKNCFDIDLTFTKFSSRMKLSITFLGGSHNFDRFHSGYGFAFKREWYNQIGFFDYAILGAGDVVSSFKFLDLGKNNYINAYYNSEYYKQFDEKFIENPSISFTDGTVYHLFHGPKLSRQYGSRFDILHRKRFDDLVSTNVNGLIEFKDEEINQKVKKYFLTRSDDLF